MRISETDRLSIRYHTNTVDEPEFYSSMFMEDFSENLVPAYNFNHELVHCTLEPHSEAFQEQLCELLSFYGHRYNNDLNDIILKAIQFITRHLVYHGYLIFEFVTQKNSNGRVVYKLESIYGKEVKIEDNKIIQVIHDTSVEYPESSKSAVVPIEKCFVIEFPPSLGGKKTYFNFVNKLKALDKQDPMMNFFVSQGQKGYELSKHQQLYDLELWRKSKVYNWHPRENSSELFSGYYHVYRKLQFEKSKIELRNYAIEQLKKIVLIFSEKIENRTELRIEGLISVAKIDEILAQWKTGELNSNSINKLLYNIDY